MGLRGSGGTPQVVDVQPVRPPLWRRLILPILLLAALGFAFWDYRARSMESSQPALVAEATNVRSEISRDGDSLQVAVNWRLTAASAQSVPESVRVEVGLKGGELTVSSTQPSEQEADTLRLAAPSAGETATGYTCVSALHRGRLREESCTPWQYVLPSVSQTPTAPPPRDSAPPPKPAERAAAPGPAPRVIRFVVQPAGIQVDPDTGGRCVAWQRKNPTKPVWVDVNKQAVPECTGPNGKPTVAQFCAFAVLEDGRRVKTENSSNIPYCDRLFRQWVSDRVS
jgi:hypothetical protein